jgi:hypothetical protein
VSHSELEAHSQEEVIEMVAPSVVAPLKAPSQHPEAVEPVL